MDVNEYINQYELVQIKFENVKEELFGLTGLIKKAKRKERKALVEKQTELLRDQRRCGYDISRILSSYQSALIIAPGDEKRFKQLTGYDVEVVTMRAGGDKGVLLSTMHSMGLFDSYQDELNATLISLLNWDIVGLIEAQVTQNRWERGYSKSTYGLPVRKVKR